MKIHQGSLDMLVWVSCVDYRSVWMSTVALPKQWFVRSSREEERVDIIEEGEIRVDLHNPVWPAQDHSNDVEERDSAREERSVLHPGNDVVKTPGDVQADCCDGEVPAVDGVVEEDERAVRHGKK